MKIKCFQTKKIWRLISKSYLIIKIFLASTALDNVSSESREMEGSKNKQSAIIKLTFRGWINLTLQKRHLKCKQLEEQNFNEENFGQ